MGGWAVYMRWHQLLFMHWPVKAGVLRELIPSALELETFEGEAWVGVVPFRMSGIRHRWFPPVPGTSAFPELNVRTYVRHRDRHGVWFFSLDAANWLAVRAARIGFHLPYFDAEMSCESEGKDVVYSSRRTHRGAPQCRFEGRYRAVGEVKKSERGSIEDFLTNRLCLFSADRKGQVYRGDIAHAPWPLQKAEAEVKINTMAESVGIELPNVLPLLHYSHELDVKAWRIQRVE
jgi:uncharacterized protein YqjF (DUF2071 family)